MSLVRIHERGFLIGNKIKELKNPNPEKPNPLKPIVEWQLDSNLQDIFRNQKVAVGSIVAAGHMPNGFSPEQLARIGLRKNHVGRITAEQIDQLHAMKRELGKDGPFRFIDTYENIRVQQDAIYTDLEKVYNRAKKSGADKVLFSVCAISAGFDLNYANALLRLMEKEGPENFVFSIFLPFNKEGVTNYSVSGQGVNPDYWEEQWYKLQKVYPGSIFIHEPTIRPITPGEVVPEATPDTVHARGKQVNGNVNTVYSDVNRMLVYQALLAAKGDAKKVRGIFAEAFQTSNALLGGGPEIMAMLLYAGVPLKNLDFVQQGLTETIEPNRQQILSKYYNDFLVLLDAWEKSDEITNMWGMRLRRTTFQRN